MMDWGMKGAFLPGVLGPCQMPPSERRGCPALLPWMNANEGVCPCLNVIHTTSNWACKEVQNWGWQPPKPKQPGRMSDDACSCDRVHAWITVEKETVRTMLTAVQLPIGNILLNNGKIISTSLGRIAFYSKTTCIREICCCI